MNIGKVLLSVTLITSSFIAVAGNHGVYYSELKALKKAMATKEIFDEDAHSGLAKIQRDITNYKNLSFFQRFVRSIFLMHDVIVATPETMPKLHEYVDGICKKANITTPTIFVTRKEGFFNAAAQKLLMSSGAIIIGQKLMHDVSDNALEGVIAHEIGHIKHNHVNKMMALYICRDICYNTLSNMLGLNELIIAFSQAELQAKIKSAQMKQILLDISLYLALWIIVGKHFEKQADEFACQNGKGKGVIEMFEFILQKEQLREEEFVAVKKLLQSNQLELSFFDNIKLNLRYQLAKLGHNCGKAYKYIYYNTFLGAHPSPQARIEAAKKYLQQQEA